MSATQRDPVGRYRDLLSLPMTQTERKAIDALVEHGSQNAAADALGWKRTKLQSRLRSVQRRAAAAAPAAPEKPTSTGRVSVLPPNAAPIPLSAVGMGIRRYILTCAQNNTPVHAQFLANLVAFADHVGAALMVARFSYNKGAFASRESKADRGPTDADTQGLWYDPALAAYICDDPSRHGSCRWELAPGPDGIVWYAEQNILPTAVRPLSGLETYGGAPSAVFPHAKIAMESAPVTAGRQPKFLYTTGCVTQRNYIQRKAGIKAEFHHAYGALLVEVDTATGDWWARQINADDDGNFYDLTTRVADGEITDGHRLLAISWGDIHASEIDADVQLCNWGLGGQYNGAIDVLQPQFQFWHDTFSMRSRSHHELKSYTKRLQKWALGTVQDSVSWELEVTAGLLRYAHRPWCTTVVVPSNHDEHLDRWLEEADYKLDLPNAEFFLEAQLAKTRAIRQGRPWDALRWAIVERDVPVEHVAAGKMDALNAVRWLQRDESFTIGPPGHELEVQHGDLGPNGARGTTANLTRVPVRVIKGHDHTASIRDGVTSGGVCQLKMDYARGPSSWSVSHVGVYQNGKRVMLSQRAGRLWA